MDRTCRRLQVGDLLLRDIKSLSTGEISKALIVKALIRQPRLLILDEPCDGLDIANRKKIMVVLNLIGRHSGTDLLYVPNHDDEMLTCITHILKIDGGTVKDCVRT